MEMQQEALRSALLNNKQPSSSTKIQQQPNQQQLQDQQYSRNNSQGMLRNESGLSFHVEGENISQTIEMHEMIMPNDNNNNQFYEHNPSLLTPQQNYKNNNSLNASAGGAYQSNYYSNNSTPITSTQAIYTFLSSVFFTFGAYLTENVSQGQVSVLELMFYRSLGIILCLFILYKISQYVNHHKEESDNPVHRQGAGNGFKDIAYIQPRERKYVQILSTVSALVVFSQFYALEQLHLSQAYTLLNVPMIFTFLVLYLCSPESLANSIASPRQMEQSEIVPNYNVITFSSHSNSASANKQDNFIFQSDSKGNNNNKNDKDIQQQQQVTEKNTPMIVSAFTPTQNKMNQADSVILPSQQQSSNNNNQQQSDNQNSLIIPQQYNTIIQDKPTKNPSQTTNTTQLISLCLMIIGAGMVAYLTYPQSFTATILSILGGSGITGAVQAMVSSKSWNTPLSTLLFYGSFVQLLLSPLLIAILGQFHGLNIKELIQILLMAVSQIAGTKCLQLANPTAAGYQPAISIVFCVAIEYFLHMEQKVLSLGGIALVVAAIVVNIKTRGTIAGL